MSTTPAAPSTTSESGAEKAPDKSFLTRLTEFGEQLIPAERPVVADVGKVLGGLIHWIDQGGGFDVPESFNPAASQAVAEQEAEQSRLAEQNAALTERVAGLETLMRQAIAGGVQAPAAPVSETPAPAPSGPTSVIPGVPADATGDPTPAPVADPVDPVASPVVSD